MRLYLLYLSTSTNVLGPSPAPVNGRPVFQNVSSTIVKQRLGSGCASNIWKEMVEYDELTINERQRETKNSLPCLIA